MEKHSAVRPKVPPRRGKQTSLRPMTLFMALCSILGLLGAVLLTSSEPLIGRNAVQIIARSISFAVAPSSVVISKALPHTRKTQPRRPAPLGQLLDAPLYAGNPHLPEIALTFDDGPNPFYTPQVLKILQRLRVNATFFCLGRLVEAYPGLVQQEYAAGNLVEDHSWSHPDLATLSPTAIQMQLARTSNVIFNVIGVRPTLFRPPYGIYNAKVLAEAHMLHLSTIIWNDEARDWQLPGIDVIVARILNLARNGAIVLLHDGGGNRMQTIAALPTIITMLRARGYRLVTVDQLIRDMGAAKKPS